MTTPQNPGDPWSVPQSVPQSADQPYPTPQYPGPGHPGQEYHQPDRPGQSGHAQPGYPQPGYPQSGYAQPGYAQAGYPSAGYPQAGYPSPGYPQPGDPGHPGIGMPAYPSGQLGGYPPEPGPPPVRPSTVVGAFWLWMLVMAAGIASVLLLFSGDYFERMLDAAGASMGTVNRGDLVAVGTGVFRGVVIGATAVTLFIYLFFGIKMYLGRNWARIVLTVLGGLSVLSGAFNSYGGVAGDVSTGLDLRPGSVVTLGWISVVLAAVAIVLMYLRPSNAYFNAVKARRPYRR